MPELPDITVYQEALARHVVGQPLTKNLDEEETRRLHEATRETLATWTDILRAETGDRFPEEVTAFRKDRSRSTTFDCRARHGRC